MSIGDSTRRIILRSGAALAVAAGVGLGRTAAAQEVPGTLRLLCSGPAGSIPDIVARGFAAAMAGRYPNGVVVDNRAGAAGQIAVNVLRQSPADGNTMLLAQGAVASVYPYLYSRLAYHPVTDLRPVSVAAEATLGLAVGPLVPEQVRTLREFIDWMRSHPAQANYGSPGTGTLPHLLSALLAHEARADWQHVSYSGGPAAMTDLLGGRIAMLVLPEGLLRAQQAAGKLRVLATSGAQRSIFMSTVPTFVEQGFSSLVIREWFAFFMPPGTQAEVLERASASVRMASTGTALAGALGEFGMVPIVGTPGELAGRIAVEQRYWESALRTTGIRAES